MCEEYTMYKYELTTAEQFVALQLIMDWGAHQKSPILKRDVTKMGVSVKAHRRTGNLIQCLYVRGSEVAQVAVVAAPQVVVLEQPRAPMIVGGVLGKIHIKVMEAHLQVQDGSPIDRMSPFVIMRINGAEERRTEICEYGGRNPRWSMMPQQEMKWELFNLDHELLIEVRDKDMIGSAFLG